MRANLQSMERKIIFYETESGRIPVKEFLDSLNISVVQKISWTLRIIKETPQVPKTYFRKLINSDDIWEVRIKLGSNIYRIFSFWDKQNLIVLSNGIIKKTQKTPARDILLAEKYKADYFRRINELK